MNPIEIRGSENSVSHRSKIMERKKYERKRGRTRSYIRAKQGKVISLQSRFLVSAKGFSSWGSRGIYMRVYMCAPCPWKRMNSHEWSNGSRFVLSLSDSLSPLTVLFLITNYTVTWTAYRRFSWNLTRTRRALSISPSLMIINAWRDEISLMEHNISAVGVTVWMVLLSHFPSERHFSESAGSTELSPRDFYHNAQVPFPFALLEKRINFIRHHISRNVTIVQSIFILIKRTDNHDKMTARIISVKGMSNLWHKITQKLNKPQIIFQLT